MAEQKIPEMPFSEGLVLNDNTCKPIPEIGIPVAEGMLQVNTTNEKPKDPMILNG
jgi:hypothetical protein